ncbi:Sec-independent protein translocase subunit TatA [Aquipuribacter hungaricus]|uniref:Sec-independent protein translocase protein TatA n=1 Tax=Aquipuribacter hungaricus TaxID=545624 RepID=A0ABV7WCV5_9MICO
MLRNLFDQPLALVVILVLVVVLFGASRLPNAARQVGRSMRIFKSEVKEMKNDGKDETANKRAATDPLEGRVVSEEHGPVVDPLDERADTVRRDL